jgi:hypothetical protein
MLEKTVKHGEHGENKSRDFVKTRKERLAVFAVGKIEASRAPSA